MMNFRNICKILICTVLLTIAPTREADAQAGRVVKSAVTKSYSAVSRWFGKKAAKEAGEEALEQGTKAVSKEVAQRAMAKYAANALYNPTIKISREALQEVSARNIKKTLITRAGREMSESALRSAGKEFSQTIGRSASVESHEYFVKRLGTDASQEWSERSAKKLMQNKAFDSSKSWSERLKDYYHKLVLKIQQKIKKSKIYKELLAIYEKGAIHLTEKEFAELLANPQYLRAYMKAKMGKKDVIEFLIRLKMSNPEYVRQILKNPELLAYIKKSIRQTSAAARGGGAHEWLMVKNLTSFLLDPKWGKDGDLLAMMLCRLTQKTDNVIFTTGGKHIGKGGGMNSGKFHEGLAEVIEKSQSTDDLIVNVRRYAKQNLTPEAFEEFQKIMDFVLAAA